MTLNQILETVAELNRKVAAAEKQIDAAKSLVWQLEGEIKRFSERDAVEHGPECPALE